ncbi:MAG: TraR/DksA family transcriptional regulator [Planctomycetota bacterium]|jgi:RNA polymerase-binding transcription factor DksA
MPRKKAGKKASRRKPKKAAARKPKKKAPRAAKPKAAKKPAAPKSRLTAADRRFFKAMLVQRRGILRGDVRALEAEGLRKKGAGGGELSSMPIHLADLGSDAFEQEMTLGLMESESDELQEIQEALQRLTDGSFGLCELCDKPIPKMRLRAIPYTRHCIPCKKKEENL